MAHSYPAELTGVMDGDEQSQADGRLRNAALRVDRNTFDTSALPTTTSDTLSLGMERTGQRTRAFEIRASANMAAASIAIGTAADPDKYMPATALPNATTVRYVLPSTAAGYDPSATADEIIITISGATIPNGILQIDREYTQR